MMNETKSNEMELLSTWERDFLADIKARVMAKQPVSAREKQIVLDLLRRTGVGMSAAAKANAEKEGFSTAGIKTGK